MNTLNYIGWGLLIISWTVPYIWRRKIDKGCSNTHCSAAYECHVCYKSRRQSYHFGVLLSTLALFCFVLSIYYSNV